MTEPKILPFAGTDEELEKYLQEFAQLAGGWVGKNKLDGTWSLTAGAHGSGNPNTLPRVTRIRRAEGGLRISTVVRALPWTRPKVRRVAEFREGQLADYLTARVRGSGPEKFDALRLREPFAPFGSGIAALTASFTWMVLSGLATFAFAYAFAVLATIPLMSRSIREIAAHSVDLLAAGAIPLPSPAEASGISPLGAAIVFAVPIAFFATLIHAAALIACDLGLRPMRLPQASFFFLSILATLAFWPYFSVLAIPLALLIPTGAALGASIVWSLRRERVREGPKPRKALVLVAVILAASLAGAVMPRQTAWKDALVRVALFRDSWLLGNSLGKGIASNYYRYTLYGAEPLKQLYSIDGRPTRQQPIAVCSDAAVAGRLRTLGFVTVAPPARGDLEVGPAATADELKANLDRASRELFRGSWLHELSSYGWYSIYYAGPMVVLLALMGTFAPFVSILYRKLPPRMAIFALAASTMVTSLVLVLASSGEEEPVKPADLADALLNDARVRIRHEAAVRAFELESTAELADALLKTADDPDVRVRLWACAALGKSGDARALPKLVERLDDPELFVRYRAAQGLEYLGNPGAIPALEKMMRERSWYEGSYALEALRKIRPGQY
ncbi:MAG TPA: HEAT repeat domain-containing protein [Planctomycetota bacterium]|nr:HEAT repeat domain-containing protein [Planctomycetota bacterium]